MYKFKAGDKVRRINDSWANCFVGETYIVAECEGNHIFLVGDACDYHLENFELVEDITEQQIITAWLDKLTYVLLADPTITGYLEIRNKDLLLGSAVANITGSLDLYQYVENSYDQLKSQEIQKKSQKLLEQKEQLAKQLADIEKELESLK
jgi:hypothetical protein